MKQQPATKTSEEFNRFRDFTKKLLAVPKKEIDRQKALYEKKKTKEKRPAK